MGHRRTKIFENLIEIDMSFEQNLLDSLTKLAYIPLEQQEDIMNIPEKVSLLCNW